MKNTKLISPLLAALLALPASYAMAGFEVVHEEVVPARAAPAPVKKAQLDRGTQVRGRSGALARDVLVGGINHTGRKPAILPAAKGFGKDVSLRDALTMIVPPNYEIYNDGAVDLGGRLSWKGTDGEDWPSVLSSVLRGQGVVATIDWSNKMLTLDSQNQAAVKAAGGFALKVSDKTIKKALERWSKETGWRMDWDVAVDYPISHDNAFNGPFEAAVGEVIESLTGSDYPIQACTYDNNTIRIVRYGEQMRCNLSKN